jgi:hypothetical protein
MKRLISIFLALSVITFGLPSNSYANSKGEALVWFPRTFSPAFVHTANHIDLSKKIKWFVWDVENKYFISYRQPFSIRPAQKVRISDVNANCTSVPIRVKREISQKEAADVSNQTLIQFFQADFGSNRGMTRSQLYSKPLIFTISQSSWNVVDDEIQLDVPICADSIGKSLSELLDNRVTINYRIAYSTNFDENLNKIDPKCDEVLGDRCMFYSRIISFPNVEFSQSNLDIESLKYAYQETIDKEKNYLQAKPCEVPYLSYDQQSNSNIMVKDNKALCESAQRNLDFLNSEIAKALKRSQPIPSTSVSPKALSITCIKGKTTKKVSGTNPKCPKGYKLKK